MKRMRSLRSGRFWISGRISKMTSRIVKDNIYVMRYATSHSCFREHPFRVGVFCLQKKDSVTRTAGSGHILIAKDREVAGMTAEQSKNEYINLKEKDEKAFREQMKQGF